MGRSIPVGGLTVDSLRDAVRIVLGNPAYRERAGRLQWSIEAADGLNRAADLMRGAIGTGGREVPSEVDQHHRMVSGSHHNPLRAVVKYIEEHRGAGLKLEQMTAAVVQHVAPGRQFKAATTGCCRTSTLSHHVSDGRDQWRPAAGGARAQVAHAPLSDRASSVNAGSRKGNRAWQAADGGVSTQEADRATNQ